MLRLVRVVLRARSTDHVHVWQEQAESLPRAIIAAFTQLHERVSASDSGLPGYEDWYLDSLEVPSMPRAFINVKTYARRKWGV